MADVTANAAYALGLEGKIGALGPGLRADLLLLKRDGRGSRHGAVLTASHEEILAIWVDGRVVAVSPPLRRDLGGGACKTVRGVVPELYANGAETLLSIRPAALLTRTVWMIVLLCGLPAAAQNNVFDDVRDQSF